MNPNQYLALTVQLDPGVASVFFDAVEQPDENEAEAKADETVREPGPYMGAEPAAVGAVGVDAPGDTLADCEGRTEESVARAVGFPGDFHSWLDASKDADRLAGDSGHFLPYAKPCPDGHVAGIVKAFDAVVFGVGWWPPLFDVQERRPDRCCGCVDASGFDEVEHQSPSELCVPG